jgi:serine/threonine protein kinase
VNGQEVDGLVRERICRGCHNSVSPNASFYGYCLDCLLMPLFDFADLNEENAENQFEPYQILTHPDGSFVELGRGSMGITYQAIDTTLEFPVALKVIDFKAAGVESNRERFLREARAAAKLRHPNVASVLYYGVRPYGPCFYAMELVEGETLAERVERTGPLSTRDALEVVAQVAKALEAAEKHGLVHRDLKPANLMLLNGPEISVKVIDFGLAKMVGHQEPKDRITYDGFIGTPAFASPEQFAGAKIDQRSDYFSLGSTLFYLLTGNQPFKADEIAELLRTDPVGTSFRSSVFGSNAFRTSTPPSHRIGAPSIQSPLRSKTWPRRRPGVVRSSSLPKTVPSPVRRLAAALLSPDPADRPQNGPALVEAITKCQRAIEGTKRIGKNAFLAAAAVLLVAAILFFFQSGIFTKDNAAKSIAVLPFDNLGPAKDDSYFVDGVQDDILTNLAKIADLQVISRGSVQAYRDPAKRPSPKEIGEALHVRYLLNGSIQREGDRIRVNARLEDTQSGRELWAEQYDGELTEIFTIQTELAEAISQELRAKLSTAEKSSIGEIPTRDFAAYELYLHAKELMANYDEQTQSTEPFASGARLLQEAVHRDPNFALAWALLAHADDGLYWTNADHTGSRRTAAEDALQKALSLRPDLGEAHLEAGRHLLVTTRDYSATRRELEIARRTLPNSANLFGLLASVASRQGQWREALEDYRRAGMLDPKNVRWIIDSSGIYDFHRQYDEVRRGFAEITEAGASNQSTDYKKAVLIWQEKGDTSGFHTLLDEPNGPLRGIGRATLLKITAAMADRNFINAEQTLAADPKQEFDLGDRRFVCRNFLLGWIKKVEENIAAAKTAFETARPIQVAYLQKWPDDPNPLMMLALTDAALGRTEDALNEGRQAVAMLPISKDAIDGPVLATELAQVYVWAGENELAIQQLETLKQVPRALTYGDFAKLPEWDPLRSDPRFQKLLSALKPIPIANRTELAQK